MPQAPAALVWPIRYSSVPPVAVHLNQHSRVKSKVPKLKSACAGVVSQSPVPSSSQRAGAKAIVAGGVGGIAGCGPSMRRAADILVGQAAIELQQHLGELVVAAVGQRRRGECRQRWKRQIGIHSGKYVLHLGGKLGVEQRHIGAPFGKLNRELGFIAVARALA